MACAQAAGPEPQVMCSPTCHLPLLLLPGCSGPTLSPCPHSCPTITAALCPVTSVIGRPGSPTALCFWQAPGSRLGKDEGEGCPASWGATHSFFISGERPMEHLLHSSWPRAVQVLSTSQDGACNPLGFPVHFALGLMGFGVGDPKIWQFKYLTLKEFFKSTEDRKKVILTSPLTPFFPETGHKTPT